MSQFLYRPYLDDLPVDGAYIVIEAVDDIAARAIFDRLWVDRVIAADRARLYNIAGKVIWDTGRA